MKRGNVSEEEMYGTFNMGIGMIVTCDESDSQTILDLIQGSAMIGKIQKETKESF